MMCFWIFHKWGKWTDKAESAIMRYSIVQGRGVPQGALLVQQRECSRCGAKDLRTVKTQI